MSSEELTMNEALSEPEIINDRFQTALADYPLLEGDIVGALAVDVTRSAVTLRGRKNVEQENTHDTKMGPSPRYIRAALDWESDDRFNSEESSGRVQWDSLALCKNCLRTLDDTDHICEMCEREGFVPSTPAVMVFDETFPFHEEDTDPVTPKELYKAVDAALLPRT